MLIFIEKHFVYPQYIMHEGYFPIIKGMIEAHRESSPLVWRFNLS